MAKIIYFTASIVPTAQEVADIEAINASIHTLNVSNASVDNGLGTVEECDFVAGSVPDEYSDKPIYDPSSGELEDDQAIVTDGDTVAIGDVTATLAVEDNAVTGASIPATNAIISDGDTFEAADGGTITVAVAAGVPTFTYTPAE